MSRNFNKLPPTCPSLALSPCQDALDPAVHTGRMAREDAMLQGLKARIRSLTPLWKESCGGLATDTRRRWGAQCPFAECKQAFVRSGYQQADVTENEFNAMHSLGLLLSASIAPLPSWKPPFYDGLQHLLSYPALSGHIVHDASFPRGPGEYGADLVRPNEV
ncbi:hypothetical protein LX36DRAFT_665995 [Colletotrichum falcatum]|nr:hypothetical protein LX36DRAFT_665995 [Colletotrichum falcatum]